MKWNPFVPCVAVALSLGLIFPMGCSQGDPQQAAEKAGSPEATPPVEVAEQDSAMAEEEKLPAMEEETTTPSEPSEPEEFVVPEGTPQEMLTFLESLQTKEPAARDRASIEAFMGKLGKAVGEVARHLSSPPMKAARRPACRVGDSIRRAI